MQVWVLLFVLRVQIRASVQFPARCESITIPRCKVAAQTFGYNEAVFPNMLQHGSQIEAGLELNRLFPVAATAKCSKLFQLFLCSVFTPICTILERPVPPCRSLCQEARKNCTSFLEQNGLIWPEKLRCERFPPDKIFCVKGLT